MALSNFLIRPPSDAQPAQGAMPRRQANAQAGNSASFASIMNGQTTNAETASAPDVQRTGMPMGGIGQHGMVLAGRSPSDLMRTQVFTKAETDMRLPT